ncbi:hypothetical protein GCM10009854_45480 [Saccharopolyspora halophila]|uniref:Uncharacterized protein n=1 Tax=Saccharopolyspora halophila TaxID=405551 RepID=A0ABP5TT83_9PSEU
MPLQRWTMIRKLVDSKPARRAGMGSRTAARNSENIFRGIDIREWRGWRHSRSESPKVRFAAPGNRTAAHLVVPAVADLDAVVPSYGAALQDEAVAAWMLPEPDSFA